MSVSVKSQREIELMREAGRILAIVHEELAKIIEPGITTKHIDQVGYDIIKSYGCEPSFLNYEGYPASICVSVNDEVVHGIPDRKHVLHEGDIVSLDAGVIYKGYHSDAARTHGVGEISKEAQQLIDVTRHSFFEGIKKAVNGGHLFEISNAIADYVEPYGYGIVRDLVGHGVGSNLHEDPQVPNFRQPHRDNSINLKVMCCPLQSNRIMRTWKGFEEDIERYGLQDILNGYSKNATYYDEKNFQDEYHFKDSFLKKGRPVILKNLLERNGE